MAQAVSEASALGTKHERERCLKIARDEATHRLVDQVRAAVDAYDHDPCRDHERHGIGADCIRCKLLHAISGHWPDWAPRQVTP